MSEDFTSSYCCYVAPDGSGCDGIATWGIYNESGTPDDYTHSCDEHVGCLLYRRNRVVLLEKAHV
jgi:hypothetical protein